MDIASTQILGADDLADCGFYQGRSSQKYRPLIPYDDRFIAHRGHVGATCSTGTHDHRNLRDAPSRKISLIVKDSAKVIAIGEHFVLVREIRAARIDQINTRQEVLFGYFLCAQVLLYGNWKIRSALNRRVITNDDAFFA